VNLAGDFFVLGVCFVLIGSLGFFWVRRPSHLLHHFIRNLPQRIRSLRRKFLAFSRSLVCAHSSLHHGFRDFRQVSNVLWKFRVGDWGAACRWYARQCIRSNLKPFANRSSSRGKHKVAHHFLPHGCWVKLVTNRNLCRCFTRACCCCLDA
jgi:hypothetical protein